jgi:hypothetical protein
MNPSSHRNPVPPAWLSAPPTTLVIGHGPYARALGIILGAACLGSEDLLTGPAPNDAGGFPRVLAELERVFIVAGTSDNPSESLRVHTALWEWVMKLSPNGEQHELAIVFILPPNDGCRTVESITIGLGLTGVDPTEAGHAFVLMNASLEAVLTQVGRVRPMDLPPFRSRQAADVRHAALLAMRSTESGESLVDAAKRVIEVFRGQEYLLDLFCRPPSHRNGNQLRDWLNAVVTGDVTAYDGPELGGNPVDWLVDRTLSEPK